MIKSCSICKKEKETEEFGKDKYSKDGFTYACKKCRNKGNQLFYKSKEGIIYQIYKSQLKSSKKRKMNSPSYSYEELKTWCFEQQIFYILYERWVESNYKKELVPSIDRKNNLLPYFFDNIELITWKENYDNYMVNTKNNKKNIPCFQFKNGELLKIYASQVQAEKETGVSQGKISEVVNGNRKTAGGFEWKNSTNLEYKIYTDGGLSHSKNIGGWAFIIVYNNKIVFQDYGVQENTTNNKMELTALIEALNFMNEKVVIYSDSQYVVKGYNIWSLNWKKYNWCKTSGKPILNKEYWIEIEKLKRDNVRLEWVKAHNLKAGTPDAIFNDMVDKLTRNY